MLRMLFNIHEGRISIALYIMTSQGPPTGNYGKKPETIEGNGELLD